MQHGLKTSTIRNVLHSKLDSWIKSLPLDLQGIVRRDVIISGGAIASALLGEKINDYDLYFATKETTKLVAQHYCDVFNKNNEVKTNVRDTKPAIREVRVKNIKGETEERVVIWMQSAGVAGEEQTAYDYFEGAPEQDADAFVSSLAIDASAPSMDDVKTIKDDVDLAKKRSEYRPIFMSQNAISLSGKVQVVIRFFGEPSQIHANYDFAHAMCHYRFSDNKLTVPPEAMEAMLSRTLVYRGSLYPICSVFRIRKFLERGWRISAGEILKILFQLNGVNLSDPNILREQLIGVDTAYMHQLIGALQNTEAGTKVDATYLAKLIDTIFE